LTLPQRFYDKVEYRSGNCWLWRGSRTNEGYGTFRIDGKMNTAHRWAYEAEHGPIPSGLQVDHLCRMRGCVNPLHMEAVTHAENQAARRGVPTISSWTSD